MTFCPVASAGSLCLGDSRPPGPDNPAACLPWPQVPEACSAPVRFRHEQLQAQKANVEAQEVALLAERERLMQDGHRQRGLEEELRRLQSEHDRYSPWCRTSPRGPVLRVPLCGAGHHPGGRDPAWPSVPSLAPLALPRGRVPWESSSPCFRRAQMLLAEVSRERGELQGERGELRGRLARLELERAQLEMQSQRLRESNQQLDLSACRLTTQCEVC